MNQGVGGNPRIQTNFEYEPRGRGKPEDSNQAREKGNLEYEPRGKGKPGGFRLGQGKGGKQGVANNTRVGFRHTERKRRGKAYLRCSLIWSLILWTVVYI